MDFRMVVDRLKEKSTWVGLAGMAGLLGFGIDQFDVWVNAIVGVIAFGLIVWPEKKK